MFDLNQTMSAWVLKASTLPHAWVGLPTYFRVVTKFLCNNWPSQDSNQRPPQGRDCPYPFWHHPPITARRVWYPYNKLHNHDQTELIIWPLLWDTAPRWCDTRDWQSHGLLGCAENKAWHVCLLKNGGTDISLPTECLPHWSAEMSNTYITGERIYFA